MVSYHVDFRLQPTLMYAESVSNKILLLKAIGIICKFQFKIRTWQGK